MVHPFRHANQLPVLTVLESSSHYEIYGICLKKLTIVFDPMQAILIIFPLFTQNEQGLIFIA